MTTLVVPRSPSLARRLAAAADRLGWTHEELARVALREFLRAEQMTEQTKERRAS